MDGSQNARCKSGTMTGKVNGQYFSLASTSSPADPEHSQRRERRGRVRTKLHWSLMFRDRHGETMESTTENLSSQGFCALLETPVACGEVLLFWVTVPSHDPSGNKGQMVLECDVRVLRTEAPIPDRSTSGSRAGSRTIDSQAPSRGRRLKVSGNRSGHARDSVRTENGCRMPISGR